MKCTATTKQGCQCNAQAHNGSAFCFFHDVEAAPKRREAQRRGGQARIRTPSVLPDIEIDLENPQAMPPLLALVVKLLLQGKLDAKVGHAACYAMHIALRAYELGSAKAQTDRIERLLEEQRSQPPDRAKLADELLRFEPDELTELHERFGEPEKEVAGDESRSGARDPD